ncbi:hypothetical protein G6F32_013430 [Rhizopus arrhizus]|nr:hypothetical protein G6F32_013430 [Rhizopus arrhizus]
MHGDVFQQAAVQCQRLRAAWNGEQPVHLRLGARVDVVVEVHAIDDERVLIELRTIDADFRRADLAGAEAALVGIVELHGGMDAQQPGDVTVAGGLRRDVAAVQLQAASEGRTSVPPRHMQGTGASCACRELRPLQGVAAIGAPPRAQPAAVQQCVEPCVNVQAGGNRWSLAATGQRGVEGQGHAMLGGERAQCTAQRDSAALDVQGFIGR